MLSNIPEEWRPNLHRGRSPKITQTWTFYLTLQSTTIIM